jgi:2-oxoglutarate dehydrogenase E1 component
VDLEELKSIGIGLSRVPEEFNVNSRIEKRFLEKRRESSEEGGPFNWAMGEALAMATLLKEGHSVRLSGQDSRRGTFSQRHAVLYDSETRESYIPHEHVAEDQGVFSVFNSLLSEAAVLGFDYGYSLAAPEMLVCWEAQFGDFVNGAQVIIDQFIASGESKWRQPSNVVLLLPHGYEGMGPEHSSARLERFLQLCAEGNMQVCNLTKPAQYFHLLRRQVKRQHLRKPLVLMTPKSLLGLPECSSMAADFGPGTHFQEILDDDTRPPGTEKQVNRLIFCSGKVFYDLVEERARQGEKEIRETAIIRVEQIYPFHAELVSEIAARYRKATKWVWCQEEPLNMGAWSFIRDRLQKLTKYHVRYSGRDNGASPAVGSRAIHRRQQQQLVEKAYNV